MNRKHAWLEARLAALAGTVPTALFPVEIGNLHGIFTLTRGKFGRVSATARPKNAEPPTSFNSAASLPLRRMTRQPPACGMPFLWQQRPAAHHLSRPHEIVLHFVSFERRRQKLLYLYGSQPGPARDAN